MRCNRVTIHCSASPNGKVLSLKSLEADHIRRGFGGIGYHFVIQTDGVICITREIVKRGCHVAGENTGNIGVCLVGTDRFTRAQFDSLKIVLDEVLKKFNLQPWDIYCHYEFKSAQKQGKTCPNLNIKRLIAWYVQNSYALDPYLLDVTKPLA